MSLDGLSGLVNRIIAWADRLQREHGVLGFPYAVVRKYGDDAGGRQAALITYYGFLSILLLLLLLGVAVLSRVLADHPDLRQRLIAAIVPQALRPTVEHSLATLPTSTIPPGPQLRDRQLDRPGPGVPLPRPVAVAGVDPLRAHLPVARAAPHLHLGIHHLLGEPADHLPQHIRARRCQRLLELGARNRHNVTYGRFALLRCHESTSKDREVAASHHGDTPHSGNSVTPVPVTPYTTSWT
jgi:hypothetical protein